jgi:Glycosyl transferases group 1
MKPRLVLFGYHYGSDIPRFLRDHSLEHIRCLEQSFEVVVVPGDCDYDKICDTHRPDLAMFEIGLQLRGARRPIVSNVGRHQNVPKVGLMNADAWGATRSVILSDVDRLGLRAVFSICTTAGEHLPAIRDLLFYWPNFFEPSIFHDYGLEKVVPIAITGAMNASYPWRGAVFQRVSRAYPTAVCPHHGYVAEAAPMRMLVGVQNAKLLNSAWFSPTCGTVAKELVRKHLEIPACNAALITEASPAVSHAGFVDMENCVLAGERDVIEKIDLLFRDPARLHRLINAGHQLVMTQHTMARRTQVADWFRHFKSATGDQVIVQPSPFAGLRLASKSSDEKTLHLSAHGEHLTLISRGDELFRRRLYSEAEEAYRGALGYFDTLDEPKLRLAACTLLRGRPKEAMESVLLLLKAGLSRYRDVDPDPALWAMLVVCLLCQGNLRGASRRARQYAHLSHPDLDRVRRILGQAPAKKSTETAAVPITERGGRGSLHASLFAADKFWEANLRDMLTTCGRAGLADRLSLGNSSAATCPVGGDHQAAQAFRRSLSSNTSIGRTVPIWRTYLPGSGLLRGLDNPLLLSSLLKRGRQWMTSLSNQLRPRG